MLELFRPELLATLSQRWQRPQGRIMVKTESGPPADAPPAGHLKGERPQCEANRTLLENVPLRTFYKNIDSVFLAVSPTVPITAKCGLGASGGDVRQGNHVRGVCPDDLPHSTQSSVRSAPPRCWLPRQAMIYYP